MPESSVQCKSPQCSAGPCRTAANPILADPHEVPPDCPNRVSAATISDGRLRALLNEARFLTPQARLMLSGVPAGGRPRVLLEAVTSGRLALLDVRVYQPFRCGAILTEAKGQTEQVEPPLQTREELAWVEVKLIDEHGQPVPNEKYKLTLPDGTIREGLLDGAGRVRVDDIPYGNCRVQFPRLNIGPRDASAPS